MDRHEVCFCAPEGGIYLTGQPVECRIRLSPSFTVQSRDWIGLFQSLYHTLNDYITFEWVVTAALDETQDEDGGQSLEQVIPFRHHLPNDDSDNEYVFVYVSNSQALAVSAPFQFRNYQELPSNMHEVNLNSYVALVPKSIEGTNSEIQEHIKTPVRDVEDGERKVLRREVEDLRYPQQQQDVYPSTTSSFEIINSINHLSLMEGDDQPPMAVTFSKGVPAVSLQKKQSLGSTSHTPTAMLRPPGGSDELSMDREVGDHAIMEQSNNGLDANLTSQGIPSKMTTGTGEVSVNVTSPTTPVAVPLLSKSLEDMAKPSQAPESPHQVPELSSSSIAQQMAQASLPSLPWQPRASPGHVSTLVSPSSPSLKPVAEGAEPEQPSHTEPEPSHLPPAEGKTQPHLPPAEMKTQLCLPPAEGKTLPLHQPMLSQVSLLQQPVLLKPPSQLQPVVSEPSQQQPVVSELSIPSQQSSEQLSASTVFVTTSMHSTSATPTSTVFSPIPSAQGLYNSCPASTTPVTTPTSQVTLASAMSVSTPALSGQHIDPPVDVLKKSAFVDEAEYERILKYYTQLYTESHLTRLAYQREHTMANRAMEMGQTHKRQADHLTQQLIKLENEGRTKTTMIAKLKESIHQLEFTNQEKDKQIAGLVKSDSELRETKHKLKRAVQRREDDLRYRSEERESLRLMNDHLRDQLGQIEQLTVTQLRKLSALPKERRAENEALSLVRNLIGVLERRFSRQNEALLTLQEEHTAEARRLEAEKDKLIAQCHELEERAQQAERAEADTVHALERMAERQRQTMKENQGLRQQLQDHSSGQTSFGLHDQPVSAPLQLETVGNLDEEGVPSVGEDLPRRTDQTIQPPSATQTILLSMPSGQSRRTPVPLMPSGLSQRTPVPSMQSGSTPDSPEEPPPQGLRCPVCHKESSHYLTMRMWQWHVNGHFNN